MINTLPCKLDFKINVIPNGLEIYKSFKINDRLICMDSFQFLISSIDSTVKNLVKMILNT